MHENKDPQKTQQPLQKKEAERSEGKGASLMPPQGDVNVPLQRKAETGLPEQVQTKMESAFNTSFSDVKIHQNSSKASDIGAQAFTQGNNVHFAQAKFNPSSQSGQQLIGHELSHVVQQREGKVKPTTQMKGVAINNDSSLEREADVQGAKAARGESVQRKAVSGSSSPTHIAQAKPVQMVRERSKNVRENVSPYRKAEGEQYERLVNNKISVRDLKGRRTSPVHNKTVATLYIDIALEDANRHYTQFRDLVEDGHTGHAWIRVQYKNRKFVDLRRKNHTLDGFNNHSFQALKSGEPATFGFYPGNHTEYDLINELSNLLSLFTKGEVVEPEPHKNPKSTIAYDITEEQLAKVGQYLAKNRTRPYNYTAFNCTHFAIGVAKAAGITPPSPKGFGKLVLPSGLYHNAKKAAKDNKNGMAYKVENFDSLLDKAKFYQNNADAIFDKQGGILTSEQSEHINRLMAIGSRYGDDIRKAGIDFVAPYLLTKNEHVKNKQLRDTVTNNNVYEDRKTTPEKKLSTEFLRIDGHFTKEASNIIPDKEPQEMTLDDLKKVIMHKSFDKYSKALKIQWLTYRFNKGTYSKKY
ncbi:MAG: DUF4157 domain-containing protein [Bernardetiaceae bacterium]|nr:DUF4157 domain-containing protein [Bernardetiaceae bacterium]